MSDVLSVFVVRSYGRRLVNLLLKKENAVFVDEYKHVNSELD